jgi:hypothetical protein
MDFVSTTLYESPTQKKLDELQRSLFFLNLNLSFPLDEQICLHIELTKEVGHSILFSLNIREKKD